MKRPVLLRSARCGEPVIWVRQEFEPDLRDAYREMKAKGIRIPSTSFDLFEIAGFCPFYTFVLRSNYGYYFRATSMAPLCLARAPGRCYCADRV
jgi:hypothetical protein